MFSAISDVYDKTILPILHPALHVPNNKHQMDDSFFDLSSSDKSNSVPQTGGKYTTKGQVHD